MVSSECYENFPLTIAEAFCQALPVITSRLGAMAELVQDGVTGLHFRADDNDSMASLFW
jgi:glycosyltransferase involved in cell wall biosynthesis